MRKQNSKPSVTRRDFLKVGGGLIGAAAGSVLLSKAFLSPEEVVMASREYIPALGPQQGPVTAKNPAPNLHFVATDGWITLPPAATVPPYHPDNMAPPNFTTYIFGFRDVTSVSKNTDLVFSQKMKAQLAAPLFFIEQESDFLLKITNLGLELRPDLIDAHTLHFHGFRNAIPIFDGEPHSSVGVPIRRELTYFYRPHDPGTYMYHCHFEETEHVHMGMIGPCFVTPIQNKGGQTDSSGSAIPQGKYVYNDGVQPGDPRSTGYDREFIMLVSEVWAESHWCDSHVQLPEWSDYAPEFYLLNGRVYPDTLLPNGGGTDRRTGDLIAPAGHPELQYQPVSSLVQANEGDRVLLRMINLGFEEQAMQLSGIRMKVVGKDATMLRGRDGTDLSYLTSTVAIGAGESTDAIFVAPPFDPSKATSGGYNVYMFYNRNYRRLNNGGHSGHGGQMTEIRVFPQNTISTQTAPNT